MKDDIVKMPDHPTDLDDMDCYSHFECSDIECSECALHDVVNYRKWQKQQKENGGV